MPIWSVSEWAGLKNRVNDETTVSKLPFFFLYLGKGGRKGRGLLPGTQPHQHGGIGPGHPMPS